MCDILNGGHISTISAHGRALKPKIGKEYKKTTRISTISAHGRALKQQLAQCAVQRTAISTISAHGRALKRQVLNPPPPVDANFNNFGSR